METPQTPQQEYFQSDLLWYVESKVTLPLFSIGLQNNVKTRQY